ncbi:MAG: chemotaxis protein CheX [Planctomycetota bacterium]|jgi:hypothetical protein
MVLIHSSLSETILRAVSETFEGMAFSEVEPASLKLDLDSDLIWSKLAINSPFAGSITLVAPRQLLLSLTEDMFGIDKDELTDEMINDGLAEILNTLTGRIMAVVVQQEETFELGIPEGGRGIPETADEESYEGDYCVCKEPIKLILTGKEILKLEVNG